MLNRFRVILNDIYDGFRSQPGRVTISAIAITIGMAILTALILILEGLNERSEKVTSQLGADVIAIAGTEDNQATTQLNQNHEK